MYDVDERAALNARWWPASVHWRRPQHPDGLDWTVRNGYWRQLLAARDSLLSGTLTALPSVMCGRPREQVVVDLERVVREDFETERDRRLRRFDAMIEAQQNWLVHVVLADFEEQETLRMIDHEIATTLDRLGAAAQELDRSSRIEEHDRLKLYEEIASLTRALQERNKLVGTMRARRNPLAPTR